jgi:hypothetical protein
LSDELSVRFEFLPKNICEFIEVDDSAFEVFGVGKGAEFIGTVQRRFSAVLNADGFHLRLALTQ